MGPAKINVGVLNRRPLGQIRPQPVLFGPSITSGIQKYIGKAQEVAFIRPLSIYLWTFFGLPWNKDESSLINEMERNLLQGPKKD